MRLACLVIRQRCQIKIVTTSHSYNVFVTTYNYLCVFEQFDGLLLVLLVLVYQHESTQTKSMSNTTIF